MKWRLIGTVLLLIGSNTFMTYAWYYHVKHKAWPLLTAIGVSWLIALPEYCMQVPANRMGHVDYGGSMTLPQLKILQEVITLTVFIPFALWYMKRPLTWDFLWAALCLCGAVFFVFRGELNGP